MVFLLKMIKESILIKLNRFAFITLKASVKSGYI